MEKELGFFVTVDPTNLSGESGGKTKVRKLIGLKGVALGVTQRVIQLHASEGDVGESDNVAA